MRHSQERYYASSCKYSVHQNEVEHMHMDLGKRLGITGDFTCKATRYATGVQFAPLPDLISGFALYKSSQIIMLIMRLELGSSCRFWK